MKKNLLKKVLALALSATMALTPVVSYAGEEVVEEVVWEETAQDEVQDSGEEASEEQLYSDEQSFSGDEQSDSEETVGFEENEEDNATDETYYAFEEELTEEESDDEIGFVSEEDYYANTQDVLDTISEEAIEEELADTDISLFGNEEISDEVIDGSVLLGSQFATEEESFNNDIVVIETKNNSETESYTSFTEAASQASDKSTLTLQKNITISGYVEFENQNELTLDMNEHTITGGALDIYHKFTLVGTGTIDGGRHGIWVNPGGELIINGPTIKAGNEVNDNQEGGCALIVDSGKATIKSGTVSCLTENGVKAISVQNGGQLLVENGTISATHESVMK